MKMNFHFSDLADFLLRKKRQDKDLNTEDRRESVDFTR